MIVVLRPGFLTTLQDAGRWGYQRLGVQVAGPMDRVSHRLANLIVGNCLSCATLEVTLRGPTLKFEYDTMFVVTGAEFELLLDSVSVPMNTAHVARSGSCLSFGERRCGARSYIGIAGGLDVLPVLGSRATHVASQMGGVGGRALKTGDRLPVGRYVTRSVRAGQKWRVVAKIATEGAKVRVILGRNNGEFGLDGVAKLETSRYQVGRDSDRMGYRLAGPSLRETTEGYDISSAVVTGAIQVPPSGQPIILMVDHQTTGGYPSIAHVITADLPVVAQLAPSSWIEFEHCNRAAALTALIKQERGLMTNRL